MDSSRDSVGINVPESLLTRHERSHLMGNDTLIAVDLAKTVFGKGDGQGAADE